MRRAARFAPVTVRAVRRADRTPRADDEDAIMSEKITKRNGILVWHWLPESRLTAQDRKSTRLNSSHEWISYAVLCVKKEKYGAAVRRLPRDGASRRRQLAHHGPLRRWILPRRSVPRAPQGGDDRLARAVPEGAVSAH